MTQRYDIIVWDKIPQTDGSEKNIPRTVGNAKDRDDGGLQCFMTPGIALTGQFVIQPWREREDGAAG